MYFRQEREGYGIGSYNHEPLVMDADEILDHADAPVMPSEVEFTPSPLRARLDGGTRNPARHRRRGTDAQVQRHIFRSRMDGFPVLGESPAGSRGSGRRRRSGLRTRAAWARQSPSGLSTANPRQTCANATYAVSIRTRTRAHTCGRAPRSSTAKSMTSSIRDSR